MICDIKTKDTVTKTKFKKYQLNCHNTEMYCSDPILAI